MNLLLFAGNSIRNQEWIRQVDIILASEFDKTYCHNYKHWENNQPNIIIDLEMNVLKNLEKDYQPYIVFAKSIGSILMIKSISFDVLKPSACLFVGFPLNQTINHNLQIDKWVKSIKIPIIILQNSSDPLGSYLDVKEYFEKVNNNIKIYELPGDTHDYLDYQTIKKYIKELF